MKNIIAALPLLAIVASSAGAAEETFRYTFLEASYANIESTEFDASSGETSGDGYQLGASLAVSDHWFLFGDYRDFNLDDGLDLELWDAGLGTNWSLTDALDAVLKLGYVDAELDTPDGAVRDQGFMASAGIRALILRVLELDAGITYLTIDDLTGDETGFNTALRYYFTRSLALQTGVELDGDFDPTWRLGLRVELGHKPPLS